MTERNDAASRKGRGQDLKGEKPEPGFEQPAPPEATNRDHPSPLGSHVTVPGAGVMSAGAEAESLQSNPDVRHDIRHPGQAAGAVGDAPLNVPSDSVGPQPAAPDVPELYDPNYTAASRHAGGPRRHNLGPDARVCDAMTRDVEYCEPDTNLQYVARKMADRDVGAIPVVADMNSMKPVGMITDRDIAIRVVAKGEDPYSMRADQVMSTDLATIDADAPLREAMMLMERKQVRRLMVVDGQGRLRGILAQADVAESASRLESGEMLQQISEPGADGSQGLYH